jgi:hypothetical protein
MFCQFPRQTSLEWGMHPKQKKKKKNDNIKKNKV